MKELCNFVIRRSDRWGICFILLEVTNSHAEELFVPSTKASVLPLLWAVSWSHNWAQWLPDTTSSDHLNHFPLAFRLSFFWWEIQKSCFGGHARNRTWLLQNKTENPQISDNQRWYWRGWSLCKDCSKPLNYWLSLACVRILRKLLSFRCLSLPEVTIYWTFGCHWYISIHKISCHMHKESSALLWCSGNNPCHKSQNHLWLLFNHATCTVACGQ